MLSLDDFKLCDHQVILMGLLNDLKEGCDIAKYEGFVFFYPTI